MNHPAIGSPVPILPMAQSQYNSYESLPQQPKFQSYQQYQHQPQESYPSNYQTQPINQSSPRHYNTNQHQSSAGYLADIAQRQYYNQSPSNIHRSQSIGSSSSQIVHHERNAYYSLGSQQSSNQVEQHQTVDQHQLANNSYQRVPSTNPTYRMMMQQDPASVSVEQTYPASIPTVTSTVTSSVISTAAPAATNGRTVPAPSRRVVSHDGRRHRNLKTAHALKVLKEAFANNRKPSKEVMRALQHDTGCTYSEVCRWFRNARHVEKRLLRQQGAPAQKVNVIQSESEQSSRLTSPVSGTSSGSTQSSRSQTPSSGAAVAQRPLGSHELALAAQSPQFAEWISTFNAIYDDEQQTALIAALHQQQQQQQQQPQQQLQQQLRQQQQQHSLKYEY